jgi:hypothetical protein
MWIHLYINDRLSKGATARRGQAAQSKGLGKYTHVSKDFREGRIRTAVHGRLADTTKLKVPVNIRSSNKKRLGPQGNNYRLAESQLIL